MQQEANLKQWEQEMKRQQEMASAYSSAASGSRKSGKSSSGKKKEEKAQSLGTGAVTKGLNALRSSLGMTVK